MIRDKFADLVLGQGESNNFWEIMAEYDRLTAVIDLLLEAWVWASGSDDFRYPDGKARKGWEKYDAIILAAIAKAKEGEA